MSKLEKSVWSCIFCIAHGETSSYIVAIDEFMKQVFLDIFLSPSYIT